MSLDNRVNNLIEVDFTKTISDEPFPFTGGMIGSFILGGLGFSAGMLMSDPYTTARDHYTSGLYWLVLLLDILLVGNSKNIELIGSLGIWFIYLN